MKLSQCSVATGGDLFNGDCTFDQLSTDSRNIGSGDLFIALRGRNFDGHEFLQAATDAGACGLVVEKRDESIDLPQLVVQDTTRALGAIAALKRSFFRGPLIAITGSSGKTTVKGMLAAILATCGSVKATRGNFNNHIGVPLTLMTLEPEDDFAVVEMGTSSPGEIAYLAALAKPTIAMVNNIMPAHIGGFGSLAGIAREKAAIYGELGAGDSAIINLDDDFASEFLQKAEGAKRIGFCVGEPAKSYVETLPVVYATNITRDELGRAGFLLVSKLDQITVQLAVLGRHNIGNALAAAACAMAAGAGLDNIARGLATFAGESGRMQIGTAIGGATLINDTYNANPGSARAAIDYLSSCPAPRVLVLGSLAELGESAEQAHLKLGEYARQAGVEVLFSFGEFAGQIASGFGPNGRPFKTQAELITALKPELQADMVVLVKGSRSARMENIISALSELPISPPPLSPPSHTPLSHNGQNGEQS